MEAMGIYYSEIVLLFHSLTVLIWGLLFVVFFIHKGEIGIGGDKLNYE